MKRGLINLRVNLPLKSTVGWQEAVPLQDRLIPFAMILLLGSALVGCSANEQAGKPSADAKTTAGCRGLTEKECYTDLRCEAIPYWGESLVPCVQDERGFSENCPYEGCRPKDADCPSLQQLIEDCPNTCSYNRFAIDAASGCRICTCGK